MKNLEITRKAFKVYHEGMMCDNPYEGYTMDTLPVVYAKTSGEAKNKSSDIHDYEIDGEEHKYTDLRAVRAKDYDEVLFEGDRMIRCRVDDEIKIRDRKEKMMQLPDDEYFYVQDARNYVGNAVLWWGPNSNGYICDINNAQKYTKKEIVDRFGDGRDTDIIWIGSHVEKARKEIIDVQGLKREYSV